MNKAFRRLTSEVGVSLMDTLATVAVVVTVTAMAAPAAVNIVDNTRLGMASRDVERELQFARLKAVATNRPMRVRFDCPATGQFRAVELIGTTQLPDSNDADSIIDRCSETTYRYSPTGADKSRLTRPNNDGPVRRLPQGTTFSTKQTLEFWPNGSVHINSGGTNPWPIVGTAGVTITLTRKGRTKNIKVNGFGKILTDR
jgi:Tfp pilus assembly protein FimT